MSVQMEDRNASPIEYHNEATRARRRQGRSAAMEVLREGLRVYPCDINLLSDAVAFAPTGSEDEWKNAEGREASYSEDYLRILLQRKDLWTWRAFDYSVDYLLDRRLMVVSEQKEVEETKRMALSIARQFVDRFPNDERAWGAYVKALEATGSVDVAKEQLENLIQPDNPSAKRFPMGQCCLTYADMLMEEGDYERAIKVCRIGVKCLALPQPTARLGYLLLLEALSTDAILYGEYASDPDGAFTATFGCRYRVKSLMSLYVTADKLLDDGDYHDTIIGRLRVISCLSGIEIPEEFEIETPRAPEAEDLKKVLSLLNDGRDTSMTR